MRNLIATLLSFCIFFTGQKFTNAAGNIQEKYCPVGSIISLNNPNTMYNASNKEIVELIEQERGILAIRCVKPGDVYIYAFTKMNDRIFKTTLLVHIVANRSIRPAQSNSNFAQEVLHLVNIERSKRGIRPLRLANDLMQSTTIRSKEITVYFSHTRPDGRDGFTVVNYMGNGLVENIAAGQNFPKTVMNSWMNSLGHRSNILNPEFKELGVGYNYDNNSKYKHYWVQIFRS